MPPELVVSNPDPEGDLVPQQITRVLHSPGYVAVELTGRDEYGSRYGCIFRLELKLETQEIRGRVSVGDSKEGWKDSIFVINGKFQDRRFSDFEGEWREATGRCQIGIYDLPPPPHRNRAVQNGKRAAQLKVLRTGRKQHAQKKAVAARRRPKR